MWPILCEKKIFEFSDQHKLFILEATDIHYANWANLHDFSFLEELILPFKLFCIMYSASARKGIVQGAIPGHWRATQQFFWLLRFLSAGVDHTFFLGASQLELLETCFSNHLNAGFCSQFHILQLFGAPTKLQHTYIHLTLFSFRRIPQMVQV